MKELLRASPERSRFTEKAKFLPVVFIVCNILCLYGIYMVFHCIPLIMDPKSRLHGVLLTVGFNYTTVLLSMCYVLCIVVHPGTIPEKEVDPSWEYTPQDSRAALELGIPSLQETKRSGDRRHCKWCAKYKPDRCHHCRVCRVCVLRMDHHCPWIYNCVGFRNHKYFYLLLFYAAIDCHLIMWTMANSVKESLSSNTPFITMFLMLFGETLAGFLGILVTIFFCFHTWLMFKAMTTIEFCEKSMKRTGYDSSAYSGGIYQNLTSVLGDNLVFWLLPAAPPTGDGMHFFAEEMGLTAPPAHSSRRKAHHKAGYGSSRKHAHGTRWKGLGTGGGPGASAGQSSAADFMESGRVDQQDQDRLRPQDGGRKKRHHSRR